MHDAPRVDVVLIEDPDPCGPSGARGIAEAAAVPTAPAILNVIRDAAGVRIHELLRCPAGWWQRWIGLRRDKQRQRGMDSIETAPKPDQHVRIGRGELWALAAALAYALYQIFLRVAVTGELNYNVGATIQALPGMFFSMAMSWWIWRRNRTAVSIWSDWRLIGALFVNALLLFLVATPLLFAALRTGGVLITTPTTGTQVIWGALLAALLLGERFSRAMAAGMVVSVVGIALLTIGRGQGIELAAGWWLAVPYATGAALCWALAGVLLTFTMRRGVDRFQALAASTLMGLTILNGYLVLTGEIGAYASTPANVLWSLLGAGLFNAAALIGITSALAFTTVASAMTLNSLQVAFGPLIAWLFIGEDLNPLMALGILLILVGVIVVQRVQGTGQNDEDSAVGEE